MRDPSFSSHHRFRSRPDVIRDTSAQDRTLDGRTTRRRPTLLLVAAGALVIILGVWILPPLLRIYSSQQTIARAQLRLGTVERGTLVRDISTQGRIVAATSPTLYSPDEGTVSLLVRAGEEVRQGQVIATLHNPDLRSLLEAEKSSLEATEIALRRQRLDARRQRLRFERDANLARLELEAAQRELRRAEDSLGHGVISRHDYEEAVDGLEAAGYAHEQALAEAELESDTLDFEATTRALALDRQRLRVEDLLRRVSGLDMTSPVDGIVGNLAVDEQQAVAKSAPVATIVDLSKLEVELSVPESYGDDLAEGVAVEITWNGSTYPGTLVAVSPEVEESRILARARFEGDPPAGIKRNQRVTSRILLETLADTLSVPRGPFLDSGAGRIAYVVDGDLARRRDVVLGPGNVASVSIESGLSEGEEIILSSYLPFEGTETLYLSR